MNKSELRERINQRTVYNADLREILHGIIDLLPKEETEVESVDLPAETYDNRASWMREGWLWKTRNGRLVLWNRAVDIPEDNWVEGAVPLHTIWDVLPQDVLYVHVKNGRVIGYMVFRDPPEPFMYAKLPLRTMLPNGIHHRPEWARKE